MTAYTLPAAVRVAQVKGGPCAVTDLSGFAAAVQALPVTDYLRSLDKGWCGGMGFEAARSAIAAGDIAGVAASDALLSRFEEEHRPTLGWRVIPAVAGGAPNVGAHLAGSPVAMRQRRRVAQQGNPLTVFVDTVSSGGIDAADLKKRGAAALALVRVLSTSRPVTLYAVAGGQHHGTTGGQFCMVRLDQPLDLARAAFALAHPAFARALAYEVLPRLAGKQGNGSLHWAWGDVKVYRAKARDLYASAVGADPADCLYVPPPFYTDKAITDGAGWLRDMIGQYGGEAREAA